MRIICLDENNIKDFETYTVTMGELCDYKPAYPLKEFLFTHSPTSVDQGISIAKKAAIAVTATTVVIKLIKKLK